MDIFKLTGRVLVDAKDAQNSIAKTDSKAMGMASTLGKGIKTATKWGAAIVAAGTAVAGALIASATATAKVGDEIDKNSQKMQVTAEQYQKLSFAAERCGTSITTLATANKTLQKSDFSGNMYDAVRSVASISDASERAAKAVELFGSKAGQEMLPLLNQGAAGVDALFAEVESLGGIMSNEAVAAAAAYQDSLTNLQTAFSGFKNRLSAEFLPGITDIMNGFAMMLSGKTDEGTDSVKQGVEDIVTNLHEMTPQIGEVLDLIGEILIDNIPMFIDMGLSLAKELLTALFNPENVYKAVYGALDLLLSVTESIGDAAESAQGQNAIDRLGAAIARAIWDAIKRHFTRNRDKFYEQQEADYGITDLFNQIRGSNKKHASGLNFVPYDGYVAELHRGERVVPASQNSSGYSADNGEVVKAINELRDSMSNFAVVLDTGALVGGMSDGIDRSLGNTYNNNLRRGFA